MRRPSYQHKNLIQNTITYWLDKCADLEGYTGKPVAIRGRAIPVPSVPRGDGQTDEDPDLDEALPDEDLPVDQEVDEDLDAIVGLLSNMGKLG